MSRHARIFTLAWDNSRMRIKPEERYKPRNAVGVHFSTGIVSLDSGSVFGSMDELEHHLYTAGKFKVIYEDEQVAG